uniref:Sperm-associated antigen 6 n=1 Tax=Cacopsylla melanoneura TaxID=428564 RepID=A0A8D9FIU3_9HEMI
MSRNSIRNCLEDYQRARLCFVRTMFSFSEKPYTLQLLQEFDFLDLLLPLLADRVHSIQHTALVTLGRLAAAKPLLQEILDKGVLASVLHKFNQQSKLYKKTALHVLTDLMNKDERLLH